MRSWFIWKDKGFHFVLGEDTPKREVIEKEPITSLAKEIVERYPKNHGVLPGAEFWDAVKALVAFFDKRT